MEGGSFCRALTARRISDVPPATVVRGCVPGREGDEQLSKGWSICHMLGHAGAGSTRAAEARAATPKRRLGARRAAWWTTLVFLGLWKAFEVVMLYEMR